MKTDAYLKLLATSDNPEARESARGGAHEKHSARLSGRRSSRGNTERSQQMDDEVTDEKKILEMQKDEKEKSEKNSRKHEKMAGAVTMDTFWYWFNKGVTWKFVVYLIFVLVSAVAATLMDRILAAYIDKDFLK